MKKVECDVIQDLLPSYIDKISTEATNALVEEHLQSCQKCNIALKEMMKDEDSNLVPDQSEEIDGLKKYNRNMFVLKMIVVILSIFIIFIWGNFIVERVKKGIELKENYEKGQYIFGIIDEAYGKVDDIINSNNYSLVEETTALSYEFNCVSKYTKNGMFYKDGYFKEEYNSDSGSIKIGIDDEMNYVNYGVVTKDKIFNTQLIDGYCDCSIMTSWKTHENLYMQNILELYRKEDVLEYKDFEIKEEKIKEENYYLISKNENKYDGVYHTEIWINKDDMQLFKIIDEKIGCSKTEHKFTWTVNNVRDEDVRVKFAGKNEKIQQLDSFFEKINNKEFEDNYEESNKWNENNNIEKILFDNYIKPNKKVIKIDEAKKIMENEYGIRNETRICIFV